MKTKQIGMTLVMALAVLVWAGAGAARAGEIHDASEAGDVERVKALLSENPDLINAPDRNGATPLVLAAQRGRKAVVELLLVNKADLSPKRAPWTALHLGAYSGGKAVVELLLAHKAEVNAKMKDGSTPLHWAAKGGDRVVAELLLANGAELNAKDGGGPNAVALSGWVGKQGSCGTSLDEQG